MSNDVFGFIIFLIVVFGFGGIAVATFVNDWKVSKAQKAKKPLV